MRASGDHNRAGLERYTRFASLLGIAALISLCAVTLLERPIVGLADNLDGGRVMTPAGIAHRESPGTFPEIRVPRLYDERPARLLEHFSSSASIAWLAKMLGFGLSDEPGAMDLRQLGALYGLTALSFLALALRAGVPPLLVFLITWVISDPGYLLYWNSFYADASMVLGLFGLVLWLLAWGTLPAGFFHLSEPRWVARASLLIGLLFTLGMSRAANAFAPLLFGALLVARWFAPPLPQTRHLLRTIALFGALVTVSALPIFHYVWGTGHRFPLVNSYHAIFTGIAEVASDADAAFEALAVPERLRVHRGQSIYVASTAALFDANGRPEASIVNLSRTRLLWLYFSDPAAVARAERRLRPALALSRPPVPNFENEPGRYFVRPAQFSTLRSTLLSHAAPAVWAGLAILAALLIARAVRGRPLEGTQPALAFLLLCLGTQLSVTVLGEGFFGLKLHLTCARLCLDLILVIGGFTVSRRLTRVLAARAGRWTS